MSYSNIDCVNIKKISCEYSIDRFFCPENCIGFINKNGEQNNVKIEEEIIEPIVEHIIEKKKKY